MDTAFYSREYNNRELVPDNARWVDRWLQDSERARATMTSHLNLRYGDSAGETIDIFPSRKERFYKCGWLGENTKRGTQPATHPVPC